MIDFPRSHFIWHAYPWAPDPYYRYSGGFVGEAGAIHHVRFNLEAQCEIRDEVSGHVTELFVGAPCRTEYTMAERNLFQVPNGEFRMAWTRTHQVPIAAEPSQIPEERSAIPLNEAFQSHQIGTRRHANVTEIREAEPVIEAMLVGDLLNARSTYRDPVRNVTVAVEYPVNLLNVNVEDQTFQICTGPVILPDLATWDGHSVQRAFLAHVAFTHFDHVEFILRREVDAAPEARVWLDQPRGRDRLELLDPARRPPEYPPPRPRPTVYNETWPLDAENVILRTPNG